MVIAPARLDNGGRNGRRASTSRLPAIERRFTERATGRSRLLRILRTRSGTNGSASTVGHQNNFATHLAPTSAGPKVLKRPDSCLATQTHRRRASMPKQIVKRRSQWQVSLANAIAPDWVHMLGSNPLLCLWCSSERLKSSGSAPGVSAPMLFLSILTFAIQTVTGNEACQTGQSSIRLSCTTSYSGHALKESSYTASSRGCGADLPLRLTRTKCK